MLRTVLAVSAAILALFAAPATAQTGIDAVLATSESQLRDGAYSEAQITLRQALRTVTSENDRARLLDQLDRINDARPYYISLGMNAELTTGTRQSLFADRLSWTGVPHYTDDTLAVEAAEAGQVNQFELGAGYRLELTPDLGLVLGLEGELNMYQDTDFMEAWVGESFAALELNFGPMLSTTRLGYAISSKSREKIDHNPNLPRVPGAFHISAAQDLGFKVSRDHVVGAALTYRLGDETDNVQNPGTKYDHFTVEAYANSSWAEALETRLFAYVQGASTDPAYTGFQALGGGVEMALDLPLGFTLGGDVGYRLQSGAAAYPGRGAALDLEAFHGSVSLENSHHSLYGLQPFLTARFKEATANYDEYTESHLAVGAGFRLGF